MASFRIYHSSLESLSKEWHWTDWRRTSSSSSLDVPPREANLLYGVSGVCGLALGPIDTQSDLPIYCCSPYLSLLLFWWCRPPYHPAFSELCCPKFLNLLDLSYQTCLFCLVYTSCHLILPMLLHIVMSGVEVLLFGRSVVVLVLHQRFCFASTVLLYQVLIRKCVSHVNTLEKNNDDMLCLGNQLDQKIVDRTKHLLKCTCY